MGLKVFTKKTFNIIWRYVVLYWVSHKSVPLCTARAWKGWKGGLRRGSAMATVWTETARTQNRSYPEYVINKDGLDFVFGRIPIMSA